ncbi:UNVERIFIED_CONTAM: hypothetical protein Sradi_6941400 [Sesamum radiatum]|uniref:Uncharacterized protein n=1 Tax=Sesamum radiatum TaxID=300843 RepID=A0AAW2JG71_SESRA
MEGLYRIFTRNTTTRSSECSSAHPHRAIYTAHNPDNEHMAGTHSDSGRSRDDYEDATFSQSSTMPLPDEYFSLPPEPTFSTPSSSKHPGRRGKSELQSKKCETMDSLNESLQGKTDRTGLKAAESTKQCVDELTKFKNLSDVVFTIGMER